MLILSLFLSSYSNNTTNSDSYPFHHLLTCLLFLFILKEQNKPLQPFLKAAQYNENIWTGD